MRRCFISESEWTEPEHILSIEESHHLLTVLRARREDLVYVMDGNGRTARAELTGTQKKRAILQIHTETIERTNPHSIRLTLIQAIPKRVIMDEIITKATELGMSTVMPVISEHVIGRSEKIHDAGRFRRAAIAAIKQCGSPWMPEIRQPVSFDELLAELPGFDACIAASLEDDALPVRDVINAAKENKIKNAAVIIGPEGDFTEREYSALKAAGAMPASLGELILRVETAAMYCMTLLTYELRPKSPAKYL